LAKSSGLSGAAHHVVPFLRRGGSTAARIATEFVVSRSQAEYASRISVDRKPVLFRRVIYISCSIPLPAQTLIEMMGAGLHGSNPDEVGWPSDPKVGDIRERYPASFVTT
jgi:hypothetical protein